MSEGAVSGNDEIGRARRWLHRALHDMPAGGMHRETEMSHDCDGGWIDDHDWERIADALVAQGWVPPTTEPPEDDADQDDDDAWRSASESAVGTVPYDGMRYEVSCQVVMAPPYRNRAVGVRLVDSESGGVVAQSVSAVGGPVTASFITARPGNYRPEVCGRQVIDPGAPVAVKVDNLDQRPLPDAFMLPLLRPDIFGDDARG